MPVPAVPRPPREIPPPPEIVTVHTRRVMCDGGGGALGHPRVWYDVGTDQVVECLYCDRRFVFEPGGGDDHH